MTVADNTSRNQYTATSGQTVFAYTFEIVDKDHVAVLKNGVALSEGTDYSVSNVGNDNGGNITLTSGATAGDIMTLYRDMPYSRTQNYTNSGDFLASEVNSDFDELWLAGEQTDRAFSQSIRKPITDSDSISMELPEAATRANKFVKFDSTGAVDVAGATVTVPAEDVDIDDAGNYYTSDNVEGALQEVGADLTANTAKLNTIETGADVTDTANVTAAGAVMDSELTNEAAVKALNQGVATTDSPTFAAITSTGNVTVGGTVDGRDVAADGTKLDTVETNADVTDATNVTAAGALMDSELTSEASVKALNQGVATTDSPTFAGLTVDAVTYTGTDGTDGQVLMTNGAGVAAFEDMPSSTYLDVTDFGATGDGTTDDTTSIQNAINHASNNEIQTIFFPAGHYKYTTLCLYHDATDNPNFQETPNRDGRFVFLGTGKLGLSDLKFLKTEPNRIYGSILESTSSGSGLIVEPTGTFSGTDARNFRGDSMTFIADNTGYIVTSESCPGISFSNCSFKQFNTGGSGLKIRNAWFFTMDQCFIYGPSDTGEPAVNTGDGITGGTGFFAGLWNITNSLIDSFSNGVRWNEGTFVNVSVKNSAIQNCNNYGFYADGGTLQQLLFDNVYQENVGVRGRSFIKGDGNGASSAQIRNLRMTSSFMYGPSMTGPLVDLDSVDSINCEHLYVYRPRQTFLNVTDTKNNQISSGKLENCTFTTDEDVAKYYTNVNGSTTVFTGPYAQVASDLVVYVDDGSGANYALTTDYTVSDLDNVDGATSTVTFNTAPVSGRSIKIIRPIDLLTGIMPSVDNCTYPTVDKGFYFTADPDGSTSRRQFIRLYDETTSLLPSYVDVKATNGIAKFGFGDTMVETVTSSPYNIGGTAGRTYYDLTHTLAGGLAVFLPDTGEVNDGRLMIVKNNEASSSGYPYILVYNNSDQSTVIAQLSPGQAGLFIMDKQDGNKFKYTGRTFTNDLEMADNHKISFGRSEDLQIFHQSSDSTNRLVSGAANFALPTADGTSGQSIITDGSGNLTFGTAAGTGITAVVQDTSPQLGGDLDLNGSDITGTGNIDVTGNVTADGATIDGAVDINSSVDISGNLNMSGSGLIRTNDGTAALPGIRIGTDNDNGLYRPASNEIGFSTAGTERMRITGQGNLLVGPSGSPVVEVDVAGEDLKVIGNVPGFELVESDNGGSRVRYAVNNTALFQSLYGADTSTFGSTTVQTRKSDGSDNQVIYTYDGGANDYHWWGTRGGGDRLVQIDSSGKFRVRGGDVSFFNDGVTSEAFFWDASESRLGLGTTSPSTILDINTTGTGVNIQAGNAASDIALGIGSPSTANKVVVTAGGNVGIGTSSPSNPLTVLGSAGTIASFTNGADADLLIKAQSAVTTLTPTTGTLAFGTSSTERMRIDSSGNVGIGRTPVTYGSYKVLDVAGATGAIQKIIHTGNNVQLQSYASSTHGTIGTATSHDLRFVTGDAQRMRITSAGDVLVNQSSASISNVGAYILNDGRVGISAASTIPLIVNRKTSDGDVIEIRKDQAVVGGIGTAGGDLTINGQGGIGVLQAGGTGQFAWASNLFYPITDNAKDLGTSSFRFKDLYLSGTATTGSNIHLQDNGTTRGKIELNASDADDLDIKAVSLGSNMKFFTADTEHMRIDSSGRLQVGKDTTSYTTAGVQLGTYDSNSVDDATQFCYTVSGGNNIYCTAPTSGAQISFYRQDTGGYMGQIVNGASNTVVYATSSDQRLKENIADADDAGELIDSIQVRKFDWKADGQHERYGMVAQELNTVAPEAVTIPEIEDQYAGVDYSKLVPMLVKEIQSLRARVAQLEND
ncbi:MAG: hypothetical protein CMJ25_04980 [Phycisphaerae bacterium]|nr:hypothetical protein [Phycisphaerae bacterium]